MSKIIIRMAAGLANRMFQYAYGLYLNEKGYDVYYDNSYVASKWRFEEIDWNRIFPNANLREASKYEIAKLGGRYNNFDKIRRHILKKTCAVLINESALELIDEEKLQRNRYLIGVFHSCMPATCIKDILQKKFQFNEIEGKKNKEFINRVVNENSVAIHVRKGEDYLKSEYFEGTCSPEYYYAAIEYVKEHVEDPVFYLFTDNKSWVAENISNVDYVAVDWNPSAGWGNHFDMQLMSNCKHNIISNSTYSWWGAFLNQNPNKIVIGPKTWFSKQRCGDESCTLMEDWIKL